MRGRLSFDGGCLPRNPGGVPTWGYVLRVGEVAHRDRGVVRVRGAPATNNVAEYHALLHGLRKALQLRVAELEVRGDSELVVRQVQGSYAVKAPHLRPLHAEALALLRGFTACDLRWVPRAENAEADAETRRAFAEFQARRRPR